MLWHSEENNLHWSLQTFCWLLIDLHVSKTLTNVSILQLVLVLQVVGVQYVSNNH